MVLDDFRFKVQTAKVASFTDKYHDTGAYQGIVKVCNNELISIVKKSYKLQTNEQVIDTCLRAIEKYNLNYYIDDTHSFVRDNRMKLALIFPNEEIYNESGSGGSKVFPTMYIHNSYDYQEGVRILFGFIRHICSNGMIWGNHTKFYHRHTANINLQMIQTKIHKFMDDIPDIKKKIETLRIRTVTKGLAEKCSKIIGKRAIENSHIISKDMEFLGDINNLWLALNHCTFAISHFVSLPQQTSKQMQIFRVFEQELNNQKLIGA